MSDGRVLTDEELVQLHRIMLEMLVEFDKFCQKYKIKYVITGGTLLGAVRHGGFIPWDDDADIAMTRREYNKLIAHSKELESTTIFFQDYSLDKGYLWGYGKLRRPNTVLLREGQEHLTNQTGVFVDIFPMDDIPKNLLFQVMNYSFWTLMRKVLWARVGIKNEDNSFIQKAVFRILSMVPTDLVYFTVNTFMPPRIKEWNRLVHPWARPLWSRGNKSGNPISMKFGMQKKWFLERKRYNFEGIKLWGTKDADGFLKYCYGDYMKLPPQEDQKPVLRYSSIKL